MATRESREILLFLTGGLNTSVDPSVARQDQLVEAAGMEYRPPRKGLFAVAGRARNDSPTGTFSGSKIHGLVYAGYDGSSPKLIAFSSGTAYGATAAATNAFTAIQTGLTDQTFADGVHYNDRWFFWNGTDNNWSLPYSPTPGEVPWQVTGTWVADSHGMNPLTATADYTVIGTTGTSPRGTFQVWLTEFQGMAPITNPSQAPTGVSFSATGVPSQIRENIWLGNIGTLIFTATGQGFTLNFPNHANKNVAGWNVYMTVDGGQYPFGYIQEILPSQTSTATTVTLDVTAISTQYPYPIVAPLGGVAVSANMKPPVAYDMAVFQDSLVAIDAEDRQIVRFSLPDAPHYWPSINYVPFETEWQDKLNALEVCNNALLVFGSFYGYRMDDLPRHTDAEDLASARSRAKEPFSIGHGCLSPRGTATFNVFGSGELCLFVCRDGIHITDGFKTDYASTELDWYNTVDLASLSRATLKNNPKYHRVEFYYADKTTPTSWKRLDFYYHPALLDEREGANAFPRLPILGPTDVPGPAVALGVLSSDWQLWTGNDNAASVWLEGTGLSDGANLVDANGTINKRWRTRDFYFGGIDGEFDFEQAYIHQSQTTASGTYGATGYFRDDETGTYTATGTIDQSAKFAQGLFGIEHRAQAVSLRGAKDDGGAWQEINYVVFVVNRRGEYRTAGSTA